MRANFMFVGLVIIAAMIIGCLKRKTDFGPNVDTVGHTMPTEITAKANAAVLKELPFDNQQDFEDARRGLIASDPDLRIKNSQGEFIWDQPAYEFIKGDAPASVNPSLWRQAKLNNIHGLFKVTDSLYQLRGYDLANISIIVGKTGWIIVDPLTAKETAAIAIEFARKHLENKPVVAIIFTHSHIDHFGGVSGILSAEEAVKQKVRIIAPKGFMEEATSENIIAGVAMGRRSMYMYGKNLSRSERGHVDSGLGKGPVYGTFGILKPTDIIDHTPQEMTIDGVRFVFQNAPESEAPAELTFYLPDLKAFCGAEIVSHTMHNLYTLRGAKARNAIKWSNYIDEAINLFSDADVYFDTHHWPMWGNKQIVEFLKKQRDLYKYIHDQTVRLFNEGYTPGEIAETIKLPESLRIPFANRGYYGTLKHNSRAVYQTYLGWYDANPANLDPLPPKETGTRYVELMGGAETLLGKAQTFFDKGEYRWVAQLLNHLVFAQPDNIKAKELLACTYDQLGYQSESAPWRDVYLSGAYELRHSAPKKGIAVALLKDVLKQTSVAHFFDSMAVRLNGIHAEGIEIKVKIVFTDLNESYELVLENAVLHHRKAKPDSTPNAILNLTHDLFIRMMIGQVSLKEILFSDDIKIEGSKIDLLRFFQLFDKPAGIFNIVIP
ncbi:MAG: MBL fold metallo-hydrolase [Desulfobacterales bacterium]|nr:MBL fold metallo-hydrolase [Desulfobacterales bacterium]